MQRSWPSRLCSALLAVWFVISIVAEPVSMRGSAMDGMQGMDMSGMNMSAMDMSKHGDAATVAAHDEQKKNSKDDSQECKQHDCCCSAISPSLLTPEAAFSWLPAHVIDQVTPESGEWIAHTEGQLRLPFANGPPSSVNV